MNKEDNNSNINNKKKLTLKEKLKDKREKAKLELILYGIFFLGLIIFLRIGNMRSTHNEVNNNDNIFISQITDNYEYNINITINDIVYNYTGKVLGYNEVITNNNNNEHYYKKKDIYYKLDSDKGYILTNKKDIYNIIDYDYLDINNIKEYIKLSTREDNIYKVKVSDINLSNTKEDYITIKIDNINNTIDIDYTNLFKEKDNTISNYLVSISYSNIDKIISLAQMKN